MMGQVSRVLRRVNGGFSHWCPGCKEMHVIPVEVGGYGDRWTFDGNLEKPTFSPSVKISSGHYASCHKPGDSCWCTWEREEGEPAPFKCGICHYFLHGGVLKFCGDSTHGMAGKEVALPDLPLHLSDK